MAEDHLHAKMNFIDAKRFASIGFAHGDVDFCQNEDNWNSVLNLQLLSEADNKSKGDSPPLRIGAARKAKRLPTVSWTRASARR